MPEETRKKHVKAITAIRELQQSELSLKIDTKNEVTGAFDTTFIFNETKRGALHRQIQSLTVPANSRLSNVHVYSSLDDTLALNIFSFQSLTVGNKTATIHDASAIFDYASKIMNGTATAHEGIVLPTNKDLFTPEALEAYLPFIKPSYATNSNPRRFLIQRELFEQVKGTESSAIHIEASANTEAGSWITIAAANVLPEVLLRLSSSIISARELDIARAHLDTVSDPENLMGPDMPGYVTMLRLLVNNPVSISLLS